MDPIEVTSVILEHDEFAAYQQRSAEVFDRWRKTHMPLLKGIKTDTIPRAVVDPLAQDLLDRFVDLPLMEAYDVYQRLMDYWDDVMQDDVYAISAEGWVNAAKPRIAIDDKDKKINETPDLTIKPNKYKMDLIPPRLVIARYFAEDQKLVDGLAAAYEAATTELDTFVEEHTGDEGHLVDMIGDRGKVTKSRINDRLKALATDDDEENCDEIQTLERCLVLIDAESKTSKQVKEAQIKLDQNVLARYATLTVAEIKTLVVADKWAVRYPSYHRR